MKRLKRISPQLVSLDLSNTNVNDKMISSLKEFEHLQKLYLQKTEIKGTELEALSKLEYLEYLNLFKTKVDDATIAKVADLKSLKDIFLWQTNVSPSAIEQLQMDRPRLHINDGASKDIFGSSKLKPPFIVADTDIFTDTMRVEFEMNFKDVNLYYTLDGTDPDSTSLKYESPLLIDQSSEVKVIAQKEGWETSDIAQRVFSLAKYQPVSVKLKSQASEKYPAEGVASLFDYKKGTSNFREGNFWLGFEGEHLTATFDMGKMVDISGVTVSALEDTGSYIFAPKGMSIAISEDGRNFKNVAAATYQTANGPVPPYCKKLFRKI